MEKKQQQFSLWYFLIAFLLVMALQSFLFRPHAESLAYNEFKALLRAGKIEDVVLAERLIMGTLQSDGLEGVLPRERLDKLSRGDAGRHQFVTVRLDDPGLIAELEAGGVRFTGVIESKWFSTLLSWIIPAVVFFALWSFIMRRMGGAGGVLEIGKSKAKVYMDGFDPSAGLVLLAATNRPEVLDPAFLPVPGMAPPPRDYSEETAREIDRAVRDLVSAAFDKALAVLTQRRETLERGARQLLIKETLNEEDLRALQAVALSPYCLQRQTSPSRSATVRSCRCCRYCLNAFRPLHPRPRTV